MLVGGGCHTGDSTCTAAPTVFRRTEDLPAVFHMSNHMLLMGSLQPCWWWPKQVFQAKRWCFPDPNYVRDHKHSTVTREKQKTEHEDATWGNVQLELRCGFSDTTLANRSSGDWESGDVLCGWRRQSRILRVCYRPRAAAEHVEKTRGAVCNLISYHSDVTVSVSRGRGLTSAGCSSSLLDARGMTEWVEGCNGGTRSSSSWSERNNIFGAAGTILMFFQAVHHETEDSSKQWSFTPCCHENIIDLCSSKSGA